MSIASEFDSTIENIKSDYEGLENIGADLTNVNKNIQNIRTCLDNIYTNLPKTTGEGSNLSLTTLKGRINVDDILGDTEQEGTPTPSSPQDINVVTGTQEVVVQNKNLANVNETQIGKAWNNASNNARAILVLPIEHNIQYTISYGSLGSIEGIYYGYRTDETTAGGGVTQMSANPTTITTNDTNNYIIFQFNKTSISLADIQAINLQVELGSTASSYVEHQEQTKTLHLSSSNLCNLSLNTTTIAGVTLTKNSDNTITANGTATSTIAVNILNNNGGTSTDNLTLPKGTYTLSGCPNGGGTSTNYKLDLVRNNGPIITDTGTNATYTATSDIAYSGIRIVIYNGTTCNNLIFKPMLNEGSTALPYEPYYKYELAKIGTYQDRIYKNGDKWYIEKNIEKLILNGSEAWNSARGTSPYIYAMQVANYMRTNELVCMSNYFKGVANGTYESMTNNEIKFRYYTDTNKDMYICSSNFTTLADFKTWLGTHNTEVRYVLATPTYTEITNETLQNELNELEKMMSYNGQTNISVSGNLPMILDVSALKGE